VFRSRTNADNLSGTGVEGGTTVSLNFRRRDDGRRVEAVGC
jgi:hypothetical protein